MYPKTGADPDARAQRGLSGSARTLERDRMAKDKGTAELLFQRGPKRIGHANDKGFAPKGAPDGLVNQKQKGSKNEKTTQTTQQEPHASSAMQQIMQNPLHFSRS